MQEFYTESITWDTEYNLDSDVTLYVRSRRAAFRICYIAQELAASSSVLQQHHELYKKLHKDGYCETAERLRRPFEELMTRLAPNPPIEYLQGYLYPPSFILEATVAQSGHVQPLCKTTLSRQEFMRPGDYMDSKHLQPHLCPLLASKLNRYSSREVQVLAYTSQLVPSKVSVNGMDYFFKPWISGRVHGYYELQSYRKMLVTTATPLLTHARICRLHGLIIDNHDDVLGHYHLDSDEEDYPGTRLVGLLLTYIENKGTLTDLAPWSDCTNQDRLRWFRQIHDSVNCLHAAGLAWGDVKPDNVLVDTEGNACLVDFGGSYTQDWVDEDKQETEEGDWQGVQRIKQWLLEWSDKPVTRSKCVGVV
ncbi:uncharacterized protein BCR38DRAFT_486108 [Pseudomassariella vexata]|uniref:Protein kinase domain-containing protein n=1 Tax=Pseudomassariella vexata TaxID=1141098 RepID=A0A1Y2DVS7_9PEZI|nr:uncharacterized protein BCR38DRAFT_486108 [Pseudomassariella vexata]ORY63363.1 hypothetical protein BCR38DRAFT_486108 [Pseudomassariella vexata]